MKVQFLVTVNVGRRDAQPIQEFIKEDLKAFVPYLEEKIYDSVKESWQYNALVDNLTIKQIKKQLSKDK